MSEDNCDGISDLLPTYAADTVAPEDAKAVEAHLASCPVCRSELDVIRLLDRGRPEAPPGLEAAIKQRVRSELEERGAEVPARALRFPTARQRRRAWALSVAALLTLALGTSVIWTRMSEQGGGGIEVAVQEPLPEAWLWDDGMIAGAPDFDGLSDEELVTLLEELEG
jgi:anti-sigma factor RsiW